MIINKCNSDNYGINICGVITVSIFNKSRGNNRKRLDISMSNETRNKYFPYSHYDISANGCVISIKASNQNGVKFLKNGNTRCRLQKDLAICDLSHVIIGEYAFPDVIDGLQILDYDRSVIYDSEVGKSVDKLKISTWSGTQLIIYMNNAVKNLYFPKASYIYNTLMPNGDIALSLHKTNSSRRCVIQPYYNNSYMITQNISSSGVYKNTTEYRGVYSIQLCDGGIILSKDPPTVDDDLLLSNDTLGARIEYDDCDDKNQTHIVISENKELYIDNFTEQKNENIVKVRPMKFKKSNNGISIQNIGVISVNVSECGSECKVGLLMHEDTKNKYFEDKYYDFYFQNHSLFINKTAPEDCYRFRYNDANKYYLLLKYIPTDDAKHIDSGIYTIELNEYYHRVTLDNDTSNDKVVNPAEKAKFEQQQRYKKSCVKIRCQKCEIESLYQKDISVANRIQTDRKKLLSGIMDKIDIIEYKQIADNTRYSLDTYEAIINCAADTEYKTYYIKGLYELLVKDINIVKNDVSKDTTRATDLGSDKTIRVATWGANNPTGSRHLVLYIPRRVKNSIFKNKNALYISINNNQDIVLSTKYKPNCRISPYNTDGYRVKKKLTGVSREIKYNGVYNITQLDKNTFVLHSDKTSQHNKSEKNELQQIVKTDVQHKKHSHNNTTIYETHFDISNTNTVMAQLLIGSRCGRNVSANKSDCVDKPWRPKKMCAQPQSKTLDIIKYYEDDLYKKSQNICNTQLCEQNVEARSNHVESSKANANLHKRNIVNLIMFGKSRCAIKR